MILCIVGSVEESWDTGSKTQALLCMESSIITLQPSLVISGDSPKGGVDAWVRSYCEWNEIPFRGYPPKTQDWNGYRARNLTMAQVCDILVSIRSLRSRTYGSGWTADQAGKLGKKVKRYIF